MTFNEVKCEIVSEGKDGGPMAPSNVVYQQCKYLMVLHVRSVSGHSTEKHFDYYYQNIVIELYSSCCYMTFVC